MATNPTKSNPARKLKKVSSNFATPWKPGIGESIEGTYLGADNIPAPNKKNGEKFKSHRIKVEGQEEPVGVAGAFIDTKLSRIPRGSYVRITYKGMAKSAGGEAHQYDVETEEGVELLEGRPDSEFE